MTYGPGTRSGSPREFRTDLRREAAERETRPVKWVFGAMLAQTAVIVALVTLLK